MYKARFSFPFVIMLSVNGLLSGCAQHPAGSSAPVVVERGTVPPAQDVPPVQDGTVPGAGTPPPSPQPPRQLADGAQLPAVKGLLGAADRALARGDVEMAASNLERAQRLAPQSVQVYQRLAKVRLKQKRPAEAEQLARKGLAFAGSPAQQAELWRLIATARQQQGKPAAAREASAKAAALGAQ